MSMYLTRRIVFFIVLFVCVTGITSLVFGETAFLLEAYNADEENVKKRIDALGTEGYLPVGIEIDKSTGMTVLFVNDGSMDYDNWIIYNHDKMENIEAELTQFIKEGWVPMDIVKTDPGMTVLYVRGGFTEGVTITGWRLAKSGMDTETVKTVINDYLKSGFTPWGISLDGSDAWYFFLNDGTAGSKQFFLEGYKLDSEFVKKSITDDINKGWMPWGLMIEGFNAFILYTQSVKSQ